MLDRDGTTCIPNAVCVDTDGNFQCSCLPGYEDATGTGFNCSGKHPGVIPASLSFAFVITDNNNFSDYSFLCVY